MQLAVNLSDSALQLFREGRLAVDRFKCPDWPAHLDSFLAAGPVYIHFRFMAGCGEMQNLDLDTAAFLRSRTNTPCVNLHIAPYEHKLAKLADWTQDPTEAKLFRMIKKEIETLTRRFGAENVLMENAPYIDSEGRMVRCGVEPHFFARLVEETGCRFLLDISHARITASQLGIPERVYIEALPLHRLGEVHVTGLSLERGILTDHYPMREEDWPPVEWAFRKIRRKEWAEPWVVSFEYGGVGEGYAERSDPLVIETQIARLRDLLDSEL